MSRIHWTVLCDFDGTISLDDVTDRLLAALGRTGWEAIEDDWRAGLIGSRECMARQIALLDGDLAQFNAIVDEIPIDPDFPRFLNLAIAADMEVVIVSDGLDIAIRRILERCNLAALPVLANHIEQTSARSWQLKFPHARSNCLSGNCKCSAQRIEHMRDRATLVVGDGQSDVCVATGADFVFAKHRLLEHCLRNDIAHRPIAGFADACKHLPALLAGEFEPGHLPESCSSPRVQYA